MIILLAGAALIAGCGGDDEDSAGSNTVSSAPATAGPDLPRAAPDFIDAGYAGSDARTDEKSPGAAGQIKVPGHTIMFDSVATLQSVSVVNDDGSSTAVTAAEGERFQILTYRVEDDEGVNGASDFVFSLTDNGQTVPVDASTSGGAFVVSVAPGAVVTVASEGQKQDLDPFTGLRAENPVTAAYYRAVTQQQINELVKWPQVKGRYEGQSYTVDLQQNVQSAALTAYVDPDLVGTGGWIEPGKAWLVLRLDAAQSSIEIASGASNVASTVYTWSVTVDGTKYEAQPRTVTDAEYVLFKVPVESVDVTVSVAARSIVGFDLSASTNRPADHRSRSFDVSFPQTS